RKISKNEAQIARIAPLDLLHHGIGLAASGTLVVAVLHERHGRPSVSLCMIARGDRHRQHRILGHHGTLCAALSGGAASAFWMLLEGSASRALRMPAAPGFTPTGDR